MKKAVLLLLILDLCRFSTAQPQYIAAIPGKYTPMVKSIYYKLGDRTVQLKTSRYGAANDLVMINLHDDETTSVIAAKQWLEINGGLLIRIENNHQRNVRFRLKNRNYQFDPNRIFSRPGISRTLDEQGRSSDDAMDAIEEFANRILQLVPENPTCIIALHNNSEGVFSISSYLPGNKRQKDAKDVYADPSQDPDDLFLTTDSILYSQLVTEKYNIIRQDNENALKDGSLSVYCGERGIRYLNCETEHGKTGQYLQMLMAATSYIERINADAVHYHYKLALPVNEIREFSFETGSQIYFDQKEVGKIISIHANNPATAFVGKMEIDKSFRLYSNMDFFLLWFLSGQLKIEIRIDPTRGKKPVDLAKDTIEIIVRKQDQVAEKTVDD